MSLKAKEEVTPMVPQRPPKSDSEGSFIHDTPINIEAIWRACLWGVKAYPMGQFSWTLIPLRLRTPSPTWTLDNQAYALLVVYTPDTLWFQIHISGIPSTKQGFTGVKSWVIFWRRFVYSISEFRPITPQRYLTLRPASWMSTIKLQHIL